MRLIILALLLLLLFLVSCSSLNNSSKEIVFLPSPVVSGDNLVPTVESTDQPNHFVISRSQLISEGRHSLSYSVSSSTSCKRLLLDYDRPDGTFFKQRVILDSTAGATVVDSTPGWKIYNFSESDFYPDILGLYAITGVSDCNLKVKPFLLEVVD